MIDHAQIKYGGGCNTGAIGINDGVSPTITNSTVSQSWGYAIKVTEGGSPEIADNAVLGSESYGIYYKANGTQTGTVDIHGNYVEGGSNGIYVESTSTGSIFGKSLGANTVVGTTASALFYRGLDIPGNITGNTLVANSQNYIKIKESTVAHSSIWNSGGGPVKVEGTITVASGVTLSITKGVRLFGTPGMVVKGTLNAEGTASEPVVFTGAKEEANGRMVRDFLRSRKRRLGHRPCRSPIWRRLQHGGRRGDRLLADDQELDPLPQLRLRDQGHRIRLPEDRMEPLPRQRQRPLLQRHGQTSRLPTTTGVAPTGPKPAGCGDSVTSNVEWKPAVQLPELAGQCRGKESQCGEGADPVSLATGQLNYSHRDLLLTNKSSVAA